ncbi:hypothetical protein ACFLVC_04810 [Chloroflexota bacterium]
MQEIQHFYRKVKPDFEYCFNVQTSTPLTAEELGILRWLLAETFDMDNFREIPFLEPGKDVKDVIEIGPRLDSDTAYSTNAVAICHACGLEKVVRVERSRRYLAPKESDQERFINENHDRMTECPYPEPLKSFRTGTIPEKTFSVPLLGNGIDELRRFNREAGLGMDDWDVEFYFNLFTQGLRRDPTNVELFMLGNNNSEHSRHWFFKGKLVVDGQEVPNTLLQIIKSTMRY